MPGTGTEDCLLYTLDIIEQQQRAGLPAHVVLLDWKSAFDTVPHAQFIDMLEADFGMHGHALSYFSCFRGRKGRVEINNYTSEWRADPLGLMQGWPPASVAYAASLWLAACTARRSAPSNLHILSFACMCMCMLLRVCLGPGGQRPALLCPGDLTVLREHGQN